MIYRSRHNSCCFSVMFGESYFLAEAQQDCQYVQPFVTLSQFYVPKIEKVEKHLKTKRGVRQSRQILQKTPHQNFLLESTMITVKV